MSPRPIPRRLAACGASLLIGTALCASLSTPVSATAASGDLQPVARGDAACTPVAMRGKTYIHPDGSAAQAGDPSAATVYHPDFGPGSDVTQIVPPRNFRPVDATDDLLTRYNLATRPKAPEARAHWQKTMANFKGTTTPGLCATTHRSLLSQGTSTDRIWSGPLVTDPSSAVTEVIGTWHQTGFDASCPSASAYSTWPGIGGYGTGDLLQSGTDVDQSNLNATYAWWEALSHTGAFVYETKFPGFTINPGQVVLPRRSMCPAATAKRSSTPITGRPDIQPRECHSHLSRGNLRSTTTTAQRLSSSTRGRPSRTACHFSYASPTTTTRPGPTTASPTEQDTRMAPSPELPTPALSF